MTVEQGALFGELGLPKGTDRWIGRDQQLGWTADWHCGCCAFTYDLQLGRWTEWHVYPCHRHSSFRADLRSTQFAVPLALFEVAEQGAQTRPQPSIMNDDERSSLDRTRDPLTVS